MRFRLAVLVAVTSFLTVISPAAAGHSSPPTATRTAAHTAAGDWAFVQHQLYGLTLRDFLASAAVGDGWHDWSNDGCSAPLVGNTGLSFNFRDSCRRHDFGYRNLRLLELRYGSGTTYWNGTNRHRADQQFLGDMRAHCRSRAFALRASCFSWAQVFYSAVRIAGGP